MSYVVLHSVNQETGRARYYALTWQPGLDRGWVVKRTWGPLHSRRRQRRTNQVKDQAQALGLVTMHLRRRLHHDYHLVEADAGGQVLFDGVRG